MTKTEKPDSIKEIFAANLKSLSVQKSSVALVCREMKLNRQQFNRYLAADTLPNPRSLKRIADYFGVSEERLFESPAARKVNKTRDSLPSNFPMFEKTLSDARSILPSGIYYSYTNSRSVPDCFIRGIMIVRQEADFSIFTRHGNDRSWPKRSKYVYRERFDGFVSDHDGTISMTGISRANDASLCHMLMRPLYGSDLRLLTGLSLAIQSSGPLAIRFLLEYVGEQSNPVALAKKCGLFSNDADGPDPVILNFLSAMQRGTPYLGLYSRLEPGSDRERNENVKPTSS